MDWFSQLLDWMRDHAWQSWLTLALALGVVELVSLDLIMIMLASGAVTGMLAALLGAPFLAQFLIAIATAVAMLVVVRPAAKRRLFHAPDLTLGHSKLLGVQGMVTEEITPLAPGRVKVAGEVWTAEPYDETLTIAVGQAVEVLEIRGATALVHPVAQLEA